MSYSNSSQPRWRPSWGCLIALLAAAVVGYSAVRYFIDWSNYNKGHQAYQQADCALAIQKYDSIINGWRLVDVGDYSALAQKERRECLPFQAAVNKQQAGDLSAALVAYADFVRVISGGVLAEAARNRSTSMFEQAKPSALSSQESCQKIDIILEKGLIPQRDVNLPLFYLSCGQVYETELDYTSSFDMYKRFLVEYPEHQLSADVETALLVNPTSCVRYRALKNTVIAERTDLMPLLYYSCGQTYDTKRNYTSSYGMYKRFLIKYPEHQLSAEVETSLLANPTSCERFWALENTIISKRTNFLPSLYYGCGQAYEDDGDWANAVTMFESFLADYPNHRLASDVEAALARSIVAQAKAGNAGEIPAPERSGSTSSGVTEVIIQNDSTERLRIVFSGPESRVEELGACSSCTTYTGIGPLHCPEKGPIGRYTIKPGQYDVVVEAISASRTSPWSGNWNLAGGDEYYSCFFIVTTFLP